MTGIQITDEDRKKIDRKFICTFCTLLLKKPMQTHCGHLMCSACLESLLETSTPRCPADEEELKKDQVFPDVFTARELTGLRLHCTNEGCFWQGTYEEREDHSQVCRRALITCVQCQTKFKRSQLDEHLKSECEYRNVTCEYCQKDVAFASVKEHVVTNCEGAPVTCKHCKKNVLRKDIEKHERELCAEVAVTCDFQAVGCNHDRPLRRKELDGHFMDKVTNHMLLLLRYVLTFVTQLSNYIPRPEFTKTMQKIRDDITDVRSGLAEKFVMLVGKLTGLERRVETLESSDGGDTRLRNELSEMKIKVRDLTAECSNVRERNMSLERQLRDKTSSMDRLVSRLDQIDESLALNTVKITDMESQRDPRYRQGIIHSHNGTLLWKIESYQRKRQDAINGVKTALYSPPFYSAQYGYKMCAKIYMNGDGFGKGSHLSLFFVVMRGDYDSLQTWPFQKKITMMLLDQGNGDHMIDAFHSDPQSSSFQRPKSDMNIASGSPLFMPLDSLNNRQYIKDDVMFIKVIVD